MKKVLASALALLLLAGCAFPQGAASSQSASGSILTGETVSGIITQVNGNEITLDLVRLSGEGSAPPQTEETQGQALPPFQEGERPEGGRGTGSQGESASGTGGEGRPSRPSGEKEDPGFGAGAPSGDLGSGGSRAAQGGYTRTGASRGFNSLSTELLVTITLREDGETPAQVQVLQALS